MQKALCFGGHRRKRVALHWSLCRRELSTRREADYIFTGLL